MIQPLVNSRIDHAVSARVSHLMVMGGAGTGKSFVVLKRVQRLLAEGVLPADILVVVPGLNAAAALRGRLEAMREPGDAVRGNDSDGGSSGSGDNGSDSYGGVRITTIHDLCVDILSTPAALASTGRYPRIINNIENIFLLEDLKVLGLKPRRLKEMLKFFYREWTELGDAREDFFVAQDEESVHNAVKKALIARKAMLEPELSNITVHYLEDHNEARAQHQVPHILVDDYPCLNKASQQVCGLLATQSLTITGNPCQTPALLEPYPWASGLVDFTARYEDAEKIELSSTLRCPQTVAACGNALLLQDSAGVGEAGSALVTFDADTPQGAVAVVKWATPDDEFDGIASYLERRIGNDIAIDNSNITLDACDVLVVVPNRVWGRALSRQLETRGIKTTSILANNPLGGNPREKKTSIGMRTYTLLNLIAQPNDVVAWRSWCGFDDYLANSAQWATLSGWASEHGLGLLETLEALDALDARATAAPDNDADVPAPASAAHTPDARAHLPQLNLKDGVAVPTPIQLLLNAYREGRRLIEACADKRGFVLLNSLEQHGFVVPPELEQLLGPVKEDDTAATLYERAARRALEPVFEHGNAVRIGTLESMQGLEAKLVVIVGSINGFMPSGVCFSTETALDAKARQLGRERLQLYTALTRSAGELVISYFQKESLVRAEPLGMEIGRIRMEQGKRLAVLSPSDFLAEMGDALPLEVGELK